ncbi:MAG: hypothetical protein MK074_02820 [Phycisphaerales bacterium]|nr:hypothetical protein [Phycisphaerales bacterium]
MISAALAVLIIAAPEPAVVQALAVRGGVLMVPMQAQSSPWPDTVAVRWTMDDGTQRDHAQVVWVDAPPTLERHWAVHPAPMRVRRIADVPGRGGASTGLGPHLILSVPCDAVGPLHIGDSSVQLQYHDLPTSMPDLRLDPSSPLGPGPARVASAHTPGTAASAFWRWELLCTADGVHAPPLPADALDRSVAMESVGRWRVLMHAIAELDRGNARAVLEALTARVEGPAGTLAAWEARPQQLTFLFNVLTAAPEARQAVIDAWLFHGAPMTSWPRAAMQEHMELVFTNADVVPQVVEVAWARDEEIPLAVHVPARHMAKEPLTREVEACVLAMQYGGIAGAWTLPCRMHAPVPPGLSIDAFAPMMTLHDAQKLQQGMPLAAGHRTVAQVRRVLGRWEVLVECQGMGPPVPTQAQVTGTTIADLKGTEALLVRVAHGGREDAVIVRPDGWHVSSGDRSGMDVHIAPRDHGWVARVQLPSHWTSAPFGLGLARTHRGSTAVETAFMSCGPNEHAPCLVIIDPSAWAAGPHGK